MSEFSARSNLLILNSEQVECLISPIRSELLTTLILEGPLTMVGLGKLCGIGAKSLYYPIRQLEAVGLVRSLSLKAPGKRPERIFDAACSRFHFPNEDDQQESLSKRAVQSAMGVAVRELERALEIDSASKVTCHRVAIRVSPEDQLLIEKMLADVADFCRSRFDPSYPVHSLTMSVVPRFVRGLKP